MPKDSIHIAFALSDPSGTCSQHLGAAVTSLCANTQSKLFFHLLHDNSVPLEHIERFEAVIQNYGHRLRWYDFSECLAVFSNVEQSSALFLTRNSYGKLFLAQLIDVPRLIYFDCKIIADLDVATLWNHDLNDKYMGAVRATIDSYRLIAESDPHYNPWCTSVYAYNQQLGTLDTYFNTGVLLLDMEKIRTDQLFDQAIYFLLHNPNLPSLDEAALNFIFKDKYLPLPFKFNSRVTSDFIPLCNYSEGIWHYDGTPKPSVAPCPKQDRYIHYLKLSPWKDKAATIECCTVTPDLLVQLTQQHQIMYDALASKVDDLKATLETCLAKMLEPK